MSNLNMDAQDGGRLVQAAEVPTATNLGNRVARPIETAKVVRGTFGDASGEQLAADVEMKAAQQVNAIAQDGITKLTNLQVAEEEVKRQNHMIELQTAERNARAAAREKAMTEGLSTDDEHLAYKDALQANIDNVNGKYSYMTKIGNEMGQRVQMFKDNANANYVNDVVVPRHVDNVKAGYMQSLEWMGKQMSDLMAGEKNPEAVGRLLADYKNQLFTITHSPQFVAVWGAASAEEQYRKRLTQDVTDAIASVVNTDPKVAVEMLRNQTGDAKTDPLFELDPSVRRELLYQAERERSSRDAEAKAALKERQDKVEVAMTFDLVDGKLSGAKGRAAIHRAWENGEIDQGHAERLVTKWQMQEDRRERAAQAASERAQRAAEKRQILLQPSFDAIETGLQLDPRNPSHVKSVEAYTQELLKQNPKASESDKLKILTDVTNKTGVAPRALTSYVTQQITSKDPKMAVVGTQVLSQLADKAPNIIHNLNPEVVSKATQISVGVPPEQAQSNIERNRQLSKDQQAEYQKVAKTAYPKLESAIKGTFGISRKDITPEAYGHAKELFESQLVMSGGNIEAALESTKSLMRKSYGVSHITGKPTLMYMPPEGASGKTEWMTKQFAEDLKPLNIKPEQVVLQNKPGSDGVYYIYAKNEQGVVTGHLVNPQTGIPLTWSPDAQAAHKQAQEAELAAARKKREEYLSSSSMFPFLNGSPNTQTPPMKIEKAAGKRVNTGEQPQFGKFKSENN